MTNRRRRRALALAGVLALACGAASIALSNAGADVASAVDISLSGGVSYPASGIGPFGVPLTGAGSGTLAGDGTLTVPTASLTFAPFDTVFSGFPTHIEIEPLGASWTGDIDQNSGLTTLSGSMNVHIAIPAAGSTDCVEGPVAVSVTSAFGVAYSGGALSGSATMVDPGTILPAIADTATCTLGSTITGLLPLPNAPGAVTTALTMGVSQSAPAPAPVDVSLGGSVAYPASGIGPFGVPVTGSGPGTLGLDGSLDVPSATLAFAPFDTVFSGFPTHIEIEPLGLSWSGNVDQDSGLTTLTGDMNVHIAIPAAGSTDCVLGPVTVTLSSTNPLGVGWNNGTNTATVTDPATILPAIADTATCTLGSTITGLLPLPNAPGAVFSSLTMGVTAAAPPTTTTAEPTTTTTEAPTTTTTVAAGPKISISDASVVEGNLGPKIMRFTVTLTNRTSAVTNVRYRTVNGTALEPYGTQDYARKGNLSPGAMLTFGRTATTKTITIRVRGDVVVEPDETFTIELFNPKNATILDGTGVGTIVNDD